MIKIRNFNTPQKITINDIFNKLDKWLLGDIERILEKGNIGYPCLITIIAGMELLGILISGKEDTAFSQFWKKFEQHNPRYQKENLEEIFYKVIRNGIAHHYLPKTGIAVHYKERDKHLTSQETEGVDSLYISCTALYEDFKVSYEIIKEDLISNPQRAYTDVLEKNLRKKQALVNTYLSSLEEESKQPSF
jgi:hypothetical protein